MGKGTKRLTHNFYVLVETRENLCFPEAEIETVNTRMLDPNGQSILRSLWNLMTWSDKNSRRRREALKRSKMKQKCSRTAL